MATAKHVSYQDLPFHSLASLLEASEQAALPQAKKDQGNASKAKTQAKNAARFSRWLSQLVFQNSPHTPSWHVFALLFPEEDVNRKYSIKEGKLVPVLVDIFGLRGGARQSYLLEWRKAYGDLGRAVMAVLQQTYAGAISKLTVKVLDELLTELATTSRFSNITGNNIMVGSSSAPRPAKAILSDMYKGVSPIEAKWITRIVLKNMSPLMLNLSSYMDAWSTMMPRIFDVRNTLFSCCKYVDELIAKGVLAHSYIANKKYDTYREWLRPEVGVFIKIPKCEKAQGIAHSANLAKNRPVFVETKYDGERLQIHVNTLKPPSEMITIYSKSKRDSTWERRGTHPIILSALGLQQHITSWNQCVPPATTVEHISITDCIIEAEVMVYDEKKGQVEEFGGVRELVAENAKPDERSDIFECDDFGSSGQRHYILVFFDCLQVNGQPLLWMPMSVRRECLEKVVRVTPNWAELAKSQYVDLGNPDGLNELTTIFATHLAECSEGIVVKPVEALYVYSAEYPIRYIKVKKNYIEGLGDTGDFAVVAGRMCHNRMKALSLVPSDNPDIVTSFYIGCLVNKEEVQRFNEKPVFNVLFVVEYGLSKVELLKLNSQLYGIKLPFRGWDDSNLPFTLQFKRKSMKLPDFYFRKPFVVELKDSEFTREKDCPIYTPRFPTIVRVQYDRDWKDTISCEELQELGNISHTARGNSQVEHFAQIIHTIDDGHRKRGTKLPPKLQRGKSVHGDALALMPTPPDATDDFVEGGPKKRCLSEYLGVEDGADSEETVQSLHVMEMHDLEIDFDGRVNPPGKLGFETSPPSSPARVPCKGSNSTVVPSSCNRPAQHRNAITCRSKDDERKSATISVAGSSISKEVHHIPEGDYNYHSLSLASMESTVPLDMEIPTHINQTMELQTQIERIYVPPLRATSPPKLECEPRMAISAMDSAPSSLPHPSTVAKFQFDDARVPCPQSSLKPQTTQSLEENLAVVQHRSLPIPIPLPERNGIPSDSSPVISSRSRFPCIPPTNLSQVFFTISPLVHHPIFASLLSQTKSRRRLNHWTAVVDGACGPRKTPENSYRFRIPNGFGAYGRRIPIGQEPGPKIGVKRTTGIVFVDGQNEKDVGIITNDVMRLVGSNAILRKTVDAGKRSYRLMNSDAMQPIWFMDYRFLMTLPDGNLDSGDILLEGFEKAVIAVAVPIENTVSSDPLTSNPGRTS